MKSQNVSSSVTPNMLVPKSRYSFNDRLRVGFIVSGIVGIFHGTSC